MHLAVRTYRKKKNIWEKTDLNGKERKGREERKRGGRENWLITEHPFVS